MWSTPLEYRWFLRMLVFSYGTASDDWHLFLEGVAFNSGQERTNWAGFGDVGKFACLANWFDDKQRPRPYNQRIALCCGPNRNWVGRSREEQLTIEWHTFVCIIRPINPKGWDIFFWDPDWETRYAKEVEPRSEGYARPHDLMKAQHNIIDYCKSKRRMTIRNVWIGGKGNDDSGRCTELCGEYIREIVTCGWSLPLPWDHNGIKLDGFTWVQ